MIVLYVLAGILGFLLASVLLNVLFLGTLALFAKNRDYDKANVFYRSVFVFYLRLALCLCRVKIKVVGKEKLDAVKGTFLLVGNHRSNFDPFVTVVGLKRKELVFISKPENFKIPFFGKIARKGLYTAIDRENARNAIKTINRTAELIKSGEASFGVYPEGTRSKGVNMLPFHDGVFKIAQKAGVPVVVVGLLGTEKIHKNAPWKKTVIKIEITEIIGAEKTASLSSHELADIAREKLILATEGK